MADLEYTGENGDQQFAEDALNTNFEQEEAVATPAITEEAAGGGERINASKNEDDESRSQSLSSGSNFDHDNRKIFVGGLSWETTLKDLKEYFSKFGEVADCTLKVDVTTGRSRGFGFVLFSSAQDVDKVVSHEGHVLQGRNIDPKRANPRGSKEPIKKVFVGGLDPDTPEDEIRTHFSQFGKIEEIDLPYDKIKGQRRAFCFITFESEAIVDKCCEKPKQSIGTKEVDVKKATPKDQRGEFGGRGRGWGNGPPRGRGRGYNQGWGNEGYGGYGDYYNQGYGGYGGYDYNQGYGGYDYNNYYNQGWGNYNQGYGSGYGNSGYGNNYGGYDYGGWYGGEQGGESGGQAGSYGKVKRGGSAAPASTATSTYHPYTR